MDGAPCCLSDMPMHQTALKLPLGFIFFKSIILLIVALTVMKYYRKPWTAAVFLMLGMTKTQCFELNGPVHAAK